MPRWSSVLLAPLLALPLVMGAVPTGTAETLPRRLPLLGKPGNPVCLKPGEETKEVYGPTDIAATIGNQRLSVAVNPRGGLSVLRWPSASAYEQLRYFTTDRDRARLGLAPNEGVFSGLALTLADGSHRTVWLRDLQIDQHYVSPGSDSLVTRFRSARLGLTVEILDVVPPERDVLMRRHILRLEPGSAVEHAKLLVVANLNPTAAKTPLLPVEDWCLEVDGTDVARYHIEADSVVYSIEEVDPSTVQPTSVAVAIGADRGSTGHQIGADHYTGHPSTLLGPTSAFDDAADGRLSGNNAYGPAEVDAAMGFPLDPGRPTTVTLAVAHQAAAATALLDRTRDRDVAAVARAKRGWYREWLSAAAMPAGAPESVTRLAKRALVSLRQAIDTSAGPNGETVAVVASLATQSPYFVDWVRDGAFLNEALAAAGHPELVRRHNLFYVQTQHKLSHGAPPGTPLSTCVQPPPSGTWFMANYADGGDAGAIPWEIDEAAYGLWTLWRHYERAPDTRRDYLQRVYPAIRRTADFLVAFRNPLTALPPGTACEDDNLPQPGQPTMHASGPVLLAMRSAQAAATALGRAGDAARYRARRVELERAIDRRYRTQTGAYTADFGDGGWTLWPVRVHAYDHPRMRAQAEATWQAVAPSFRAPDGPRKAGQYEAKALLGLAHHYRTVNPAGLERVKRGLRWIAEVQTSPTGILGESWMVRDGRVVTYVSQPHVWEQALFYLAALEAYGRTGEPEVTR